MFDVRVRRGGRGGGAREGGREDGVGGCVNDGRWICGKTWGGWYERFNLREGNNLWMNDFSRIENLRFVGVGGGGDG